MKKDWKIGILLMTLLSLLLAACSGSDKPATKDKTVAVSEQVAEESEQRIIAGTVVVADILDKLELDAIAVPETEKQLAKRFEDLPTIGNAMEPDMEIVKSLNPTEVLSVSTLEYDLQDKFKQLNIPVDF